MHGSFYILSLPEVYRKLKEELLTAWPDLNHDLSLSELEKLPYLVINPFCFLQYVSLL